MVRYVVFLLGFLAIDIAHCYLESVAASVIGSQNDDISVVQSTEPFSAMVAFHCGYRNRYFSKEGGGSWITDIDPQAGCLTGKLDILKYCRKVYPGLRITNIVESTREYELPSWCKLDGHPCKSTFKVKPYRCVVGNFESEALLVPEHCHFGHVDDQKLCKDFDYWNETAQKECRKRQPEVHVVKSFAMLEPCGLDMFSGVEYVCCPKNLVSTKPVPNQPTIDVKVKVNLGDEQSQKTQPQQNDDDESSEESDDDDDDQETSSESKKSNASQPVKKRVLTTTGPSTKLRTNTATVVKEVQTEGGDDDDDDDDSEEKTTTEDPYFRAADPDREYVVYRSAIDRLEKKHRQKVTEALKKLSEAEAKYQQNNEHNEARVEALKAEFKHSMAALEREHHDERHRVEQVHEQRVSATLNERKRQALRLYRQALAGPEGQARTHRVLRALQAYVRAEEKDRMHALNRYRYLLKADAQEAANVREGMIKKLQDIDLRINGTIEMTRDVAGLMEKVKPAIVEFWQTFRDENTPGRVDDSLTWIGDIRNGERVMEFYKKQNEYNFHKEQEQSHQHAHPSPTGESDIRAPVIPQTIVVSQKVEVKENVEHDEMKHAHAFSLKESFHHAAAMREEILEPSNDSHHYGYVVLAVAGVTMLMAIVVGMVVFRRRCSMHAQGFMAVDAMTPEERHVSGMQVNGYENPTYKYFDAKPA